MRRDRVEIETRSRCRDAAEIRPRRGLRNAWQVVQRQLSESTESVAKLEMKLQQAR